MKLLKIYFLSASVFLTSAIVYGQTPTAPKTIETAKKSEVAFKKICVALAEHFAKKNIAEINKYINPKIGIFVITRPGAMDNFSGQKKLDEQNPLPFQYPYGDTLNSKKISLKYGAAPKYDCGTESWNKKGFIADSSAKYNRISDIMRFRIKYEQAKYSKEETDKIRTAERINRKIVFTEIAKNHGIVFYLTYLNGKWYLYLLDTVASDCGA